MTGSLKSLNQFEIRRATLQDAPAIIDILGSSIRDLCSSHYTAAEIEAWSGEKQSLRSWEHTIARDFVWVLTDSEMAVGFCHFAVMDDIYGELMGLYLTEIASGNGFGRQLFLKALEEARSHQLSRIDLLAARNAVEFYLHLGFKISGDDISLPFRDQLIRATPMELWLN